MTPLCARPSKDWGGRSARRIGASDSERRRSSATRRVASPSESCQIARRAMASCRRFAVACAGSAKPTLEAGVLRRQALGWLGGGVLGGMALAGGSLRAASLTRLQLAKDAAAPQLYDDDMILGKADAPVTIIEYASLTCPHCAHFATTTFPKIRKDLIDTGKVRWVYRDFLW